MQELARSGVKRLAVMTPGFAADCLETLEEIGVENAEYFHEAGGEKFAALPCLNDSDEGMAVLEAVARKELAELGVGAFSLAGEATARQPSLTPRSSSSARISYRTARRSPPLP